jgi:hypothetical protein
MVYRVTLDLAGKSEREVELLSADGRAAIAIDGTTVAVSDVNASSLDEAQRRAQAVAARLLDILSSMYDYCLALGQADPANGRMDQVQSALCEADDGLSTQAIHDSSCVSVTVRLQCHDSAGNEVSDSWRLGLIPFEHLPAMAYFRSGELAQNPFHKFRDFYLAIENAASYMNPGSQYKRLLGRTLKVVYQDRLGELVAAAAAAGLSCTEAEAITIVRDCLWDTHRLRLFHAGKKPAIVVSDPDGGLCVQQVLPLAKRVARDMIRAAAENILEAAGRDEDTSPIPKSRQ